MMALCHDRRLPGTTLSSSRDAMRYLVPVTLFLLAPLPAAASSSDWLTSEGGSVRLLTSGMPDAQGNLAGALEIDLKPGWKTYWRDPGSAGVPPTVAPASGDGFVSAEIAFPSPERLDADGTEMIGYKHSVTLPLTLRFAPGVAAGRIEAAVFLGICERICIPVGGQIAVDVAEAPENPDDSAAVNAARAALPPPASPEFRVEPIEGGSDTLLLTATVPQGAEVTDLFVATPEGYVLDTPRRADIDGVPVFSVAVIERPAERTDGTMHYTLATSAGAVSGELPLP